MEKALVEMLARALAKKGTKEAVKTGVDTASQLKFSKHANINVPRVEGESLKFINQNLEKLQQLIY